MKYLSLCSGIEAATVAWKPLGWNAVGFAEVEPFPSAVLAHHYPDVKNLGDINNFKEWKIDEPRLLVSGTPCQSFSVAGLRKGISDPRGGLLLRFLEIAQRYRPQWLLWENVPGVLSSNRGRDFGTLLGGLSELGYGWSYRVLDAQWIRTHRFPRAVPQRRRRVFVIGYLGDWKPAAKVLFERESLCRDSTPSRKTRETVAATITSGFGSRGVDADQVANGNCALGFVPGIAGSLDTQCGGAKLTHQSVSNGHVIGTLTARMFNALGARDVEQGALLAVDTYNGTMGNSAPTLCTKGDHASGNAAVMYPLVLEDQGGSIINVRQDGTVGTLRSQSKGHEPSILSGTNPTQKRKIKPIAFDSYNNSVTGDVSKTLDTGQDYHHVPNVFQKMAVSFEPGIASRDGGESRFNTEVTGTLRKNMGDNQTAVAVCLTASNDPSRSPQSSEVTQQVASVYSSSMQVRRLTPVECERLMGFPDDYTNIPWRKKSESPDGPRYKALGNSMAVNCIEWIGERIKAVDNQCNAQKK